MRPTFEQAKSQYVHRYTIEHVPQWVIDARKEGWHYKPHFATDREWYNNTKFPGERGLHGNSKHCETSNLTWPLGNIPERSAV